MKTNIKQRKVQIITEIHPQHLGSMSEAKRMVLQSKIGGADFVKVQLYDSKKLFNNSDRAYLQFSKQEFFEIVSYSRNLGIEVFASIFDEEKINWCEEVNINHYKIASRTVKEDKNLCKKIIETGKTVFISLGMHDYKKKGLPFSNKNVIYFYCVSKYPTNLSDIEMPNFKKNKIIQGFSDHTIGIGACIYAVSRGAKFIEKHFSNNKSLATDTQMAHVCSMDQDDLIKLREYSDTITLIQSNE